MPDFEIPRLDITALLRAHQLEPHKGLGQNFLSDTGLIRKIIAAADIAPEDTVLEIGSGLGSLTLGLSKVARQVVAVELDRRLIPVLEDVLKDCCNVRLVQGDILKLDPGSLLQGSGYVVVANIPYYITSAVIEHLLEADVKPARMVLTIQREVAVRICAEPGDMNQLALSVQVYGSPRVVGRIPAGAFYPAPAVDSAVIRVDLYQQPRIPTPLLGTFFQLARAGFGQKRKILRNSLAAGLKWEPERVETLLHTAGIDPKRRAETLNLEEWQIMTHNFQRMTP
jgi:16S rRNA (adenine1518-N6/adenine1519-N6)-dimethyltransferase